MTLPDLGPRRILIIRLSALGDVVMASGLIRSLADRYPHAELSWLTEAPAAPLIRHNPRLTQVLIWPRSQWQQLWKARRWRELAHAVRRFRSELRACNFDLVLDAQGLLKSGVCAWLTGAPRRVSIMAREGSRLLVHEKILPPAAADDRISAEYRFAAEYFGAPKDSYQLDLAIGTEPAAKIEALLTAQQLNGPMVALCPFTTRPQKHWFEDHWADLATSLMAHGLTPLILGGPSDKEAGARIASQCPGAVNLADQLKLDESAALIARCQLLIGVDTGLTHMGTALLIPTVALFGSTRPYLQTGSQLTCVMYEALPCSPCRRHPTCHGRFDCMRQLTVDRVLQQALIQRSLGAQS